MEKLKESWRSSHSLLCVGLDPDLKRLPAHLLESDNAIFRFNREIIDQTADLVCAYKPQFAHHAAHGALDQLQQTIDYLKDKYPKIPIILDAKRGDIGSTAEMYAQEAFDQFRVDAVTVNPFLGGDSLEPFLKRKDKGVIILCRTSNPGAKDIQDLPVNGQKLYHHIAQLACQKWNQNKNILLVVGATCPHELKEIREIVGDIPLLVPGIGAQGGNLESVLKSGLTHNGDGLIISSSRSIIYAGAGQEYALAARAEAQRLNNEINQYR